jgi:hypothetical protein
MKLDAHKNIRTVEALLGEEDDLGGYAYAIALLQFAAMALGYMAVITLDKVEGGGNGLSKIAGVLADAGLWLLLIPLGWYVGAMIVMRACPPKTAQQIIAWSGSLLAVVIVVLMVLSVF